MKLSWALALVIVTSALHTVNTAHASPSTSVKVLVETQVRVRLNDGRELDGMLLNATSERLVVFAGDRLRYIPWADIDVVRAMWPGRTSIHAPDHSFVPLLLPLGIGQFHNAEPTKGALFLGAQSALLTINIGHLFFEWSICAGTRFRRKCSSISVGNRVSLPRKVSLSGTIQPNPDRQCPPKSAPMADVRAFSVRGSY